jgi:protein-tyrosine phosphatase
LRVKEGLHEEETDDKHNLDFRRSDRGHRPRARTDRDGVLPGPDGDVDGAQQFRARAHTRDVETLARWGTQALVTLLDDVELARLRLHALPGLLSAAGITWYCAPLAPERAPTPGFESVWSKIGPVLRDTLWQGGKVALHCRDGRDRTGMVAARLLVELGCHPLDAINRVRGARPGAIASAEQEAYVRRQQAVPEPYEGMQLALLEEDPYRFPPTGWSTASAFGAVPAATHLQGLPSQLIRTQGVAGAADSK